MREIWTNMSLRNVSMALHHLWAVKPKLWLQQWEDRFLWFGRHMWSPVMVLTNSGHALNYFKSPFNKQWPCKDSRSLENLSLGLKTEWLADKLFLGMPYIRRLWPNFQKTFTRLRTCNDNKHVWFWLQRQDEKKAAEIEFWPPYTRRPRSQEPATTLISL